MLHRRSSSALALLAMASRVQADCPGGDVAEIVKLPSIVSFFTAEFPRAFVILEVKDAAGGPVCRQPVECKTRDPDLVDFLEPVCFTNDDGIAANVLIRKVDDGQSVYTVRAGAVEIGPFPIRTFGWHIDGSPNQFKGKALADFHGPKQVLQGTVSGFIAPLPAGTLLRAWSIDPRIAEPIAGAIVSADRFTQDVEIVILARRLGKTTLLVDTVDADIQEIEVRGDLNPPFTRGDCDASGAIDIADAIRVLDFLFLHGVAPPLEEACNADDRGGLDVTDAVWLLRHLFQGGPAPPEPFPNLGPDPTPP